MSAHEFAMIQEMVHKLVITLGGYWSPLSATARLAEEVGELGVELAREPLHRNALASEMADLLVISVCLANQYCVSLADHAVKHPTSNTKSQCRRKDRLSLLSSILHASGLVARIVNHYEGDKSPSPARKYPTIGEAIGALAATLFEAASALKINLSESVTHVVQGSMRRDIGRFRARYDPCASLALTHFQQIRENTECPFAKRSKVWGCPDWNPLLSLEDNVERAVQPLTRFVRLAKFENLDGFLLEAPKCYGDSLSELASTVRRVLTYLSDRDPAEEHVMRNFIGHSNWQFAFGGTRLFVTSFGPCYSENSSRYGFNADSVFILLQPEESFRHHLGESKDVIHEAIKRKFARAGRSYTGLMSSLGAPGENEALRYVKPLNETDPPVQWWL